MVKIDAGGNMPEGIIEYHQDTLKINKGTLKKVVALNFWGTILPTQIFGDAAARHGERSMLNLSSIAVNRVIGKILGYNMDKASVNALRNGLQWSFVEDMVMLLR